MPPEPQTSQTVVLQPLRSPPTSRPNSACHHDLHLAPLPLARASLPASTPRTQPPTRFHIQSRPRMGSSPATDQPATRSHTHQSPPPKSSSPPTRAESPHACRSETTSHTAEPPPDPDAPESAQTPAAGVALLTSVHPEWRATLLPQPQPHDAHPAALHPKGPTASGLHLATYQSVRATPQ
jgi:hypothetical protein